MKERALVAAAIVVAIALFLAGLLVGHARTNCGEVYNPDGSHQHQCWWVHHTEG